MEKIRQQLLYRLYCGWYPAGEKLPSEAKLAESLGCSHNMVHRALQDLVQKGLLCCRARSGYFPAPQQMTGVSGTGSTVAFLLEGEQNPPGGPRLGALQQEALKRGIRLLPHSCPPEALEQKLSELMDDTQLSGILFQTHCGTQWNNAFARALREHYPLVTLDTPVFHNVFAHVGSNLFEIGFYAARLISRKYRHPLYIGYPLAPNNNLRGSGFLTGCRFFGLPEPLRLECAPSAPGDTGRIAEFLRRNCGRFDAVFAATRNFTTLVIKCCMEYGLQPGCDFGLLGADCQQISPEQPFTVDVLLQRYDLEAQSAFDVWNTMYRNRGSGIAVSRTVSAVYLAGNTLTPKNKE